MDVFRSTWEAERPEHAEAGALYGSEASVYCIVCDARSDHPAGRQGGLRGYASSGGRA